MAKYKDYYDMFDYDLTNKIYDTRLPEGWYDKNIVDQSIINDDGSIDLDKFQRGVVHRRNYDIYNKLMDDKTLLGEGVYPDSLLGHAFTSNRPVNPHIFNYIEHHPDHKDFLDQDHQEALRKWHSNIGNLYKFSDRIPDKIIAGKKLSSWQAPLFNNAVKATNRLLKNPSEFYRFIRLPQYTKPLSKGRVIPLYGPTSVTKNPIVASNMIRRESFKSGRRGIPQLIIINKNPNTKGIVWTNREQEINLSPIHELKIDRIFKPESGLRIASANLINRPEHGSDKHKRLQKAFNRLSMYNKPLSKTNKDRIKRKINKLSYRLYGPKI